jgi:DnaJ-class molecular chaperone
LNKKLIDLSQMIFYFCDVLCDTSTLSDVIIMMKIIHTHYDNLKVAQDAPPEVIRAAYKILCKKFHPDHHQNDSKTTKTFQLISVAYHVLSDPIARREHDAWIAKEEQRLAKETAQLKPTQQKQTQQKQTQPIPTRSHQVRRTTDRRKNRAVYLRESRFTEFGRWMPNSRDLVFWVSFVCIGFLLLSFFRPR